MAGEMHAFRRDSQMGRTDQTSVLLASNGEYWQAWYYDHHGKRRNKSLGPKKDISKRMAGKMCDRLAQELQLKPQLLTGTQAPRLGES